MIDNDKINWADIHLNTTRTLRFLRWYQREHPAMSASEWNSVDDAALLLARLAADMEHRITRDE